ncbi:MAG: hypothetical protein AAB250_11395, partial [Bdellovibrionota bacterium]
GVLYLDNRRNGRTFTEGDLYLGSALASLISLQLALEKQAALARVEENMARYFAPDVVERIVEQSVGSGQVGLDVQERAVTVLFGDMEGFTGAGLYDSDGVNLYKKLDGGGFDRNQPRKWEKIEEDLREVIPRLFSGIFNDRAFMEREWFGINGNNHLAIKGALAIHGAFPLKGFGGEWGELANLVAVTTDIYRANSDYGKILLNAQHYDLAVTNPPAKEDLQKVGEDPNQAYSTEEILVSTLLADPVENQKSDSWKKWPIEQIRRSSVLGGADVLKTEDSRNEILEVAHALHSINAVMAKIFGKPVAEFPIDAELKIFGPSRIIIIKQARPFVHATRE